jgi:hypothetical protein
MERVLFRRVLSARNNNAANKFPLSIFMGNSPAISRHEPTFEIPHCEKSVCSLTKHNQPRIKPDSVAASEMEKSRTSHFKKPC